MSKNHVYIVFLYQLEAGNLPLYNVLCVKWVEVELHEGKTLVANQWRRNRGGQSGRLPPPEVNEGGVAPSKI